MKTQLSYPEYRKYHNEKSYFKIISETLFEEIKITGKKAKLHAFEAKILPDRNYIYDLTFNHEAHWTSINEEEYESIKTAFNI